ncbi:MAG: sulfatase-like hydrolase/transferase [Verrucomicrobia bacterium]|nr:sulfatase-like hydrolase/transferase [Verrucomicrobiota bacterium]
MKPILAFLCGLCALAGAAFAADAPAQRPNILLVLCDDLGYGDLACFGDKSLHSPNLDKFAAEGLRLTSCYAAHGNCTPSLTALMTGRTPTRVGVRNWIAQDSPVHVRRSEVTISTLLKQAGYATCHSGKWHMNGQFNQPTQPQPGDHGFEHWFSTQNNALPNHHNPDNFVRNGQEAGKLEGYSAHLVVDEATRWLSSGRDAAKPFFLYVCFHEPHEPLASDPKYTKLYPSDDPSYSAHHGNITQMDDAFGRLMRTLDERGLRENTFVFFTSDNGPAITPMHPHGSAGPLRDKKGSLHEGGIRVPGIVRWPGKTQPGSASDEPVCGVDFLPTACAIAGIEPPRDRALDGANFLPVLKGKPVARSKPLYWHFNRASSDAKVALRAGDWKLLATLDKNLTARSNDITEEDERLFKEAEPAAFSLYNLRDDIGETTDLAAKEPAKLAELKALLLAKYREVRAESPTWPAWQFTGAEGKRIEWPDYWKKRQGAKKGAAKK